ncbi:MAG: hypothetical protein ABJA78_02670 [Ferruginibacter sp.]
MNDLSPALKNWIPLKLFFDKGEQLCSWLFTGDENFSEPFFDGTISKCRKLAPNHSRYKAVSNIEMIQQWAANIDAVEPVAIIFHVSRCGSTLATQQLGIDEANIVLSEVPFFDELLRAKEKFTGADKEQLFKKAVSFYAAKKNPLNQRCFIKTDSWHIFFYKELRKSFPGIPFILLYRRPDEVIRSHRKRRGMHAVPGLIDPELFGLDKEKTASMNFDEYLAKVLEQYFAGFLNILKKDPLSFPVNYNEGAMAVIKKITAVSATPVTAACWEQMKQRSAYHAKYPDQVFNESVTATEIEDYLQPAFELYDNLEKIRLK